MQPLKISDYARSAGLNQLIPVNGTETTNSKFQVTLGKR